MLQMLIVNTLLDVADANSKDLAKRTILDKIFKDRALNPKCDGYDRGLASMVYTFFIRKQDQEWKQM